jgi:site-specific DNA-cytosine methylase
MKYLSLCSGIEAATVAWHPLGWEAVAYSEIERFPSEVLAHHYPNTPNLGDMTKFKEWTNVSNVDVLVGGTPCQSFSVAGLRKGLDDPRGNLMLTYLAIADKYRPKWLVWENVPGVLSSNGGHDFASFLRGLGELGYGFAYRVLDAQYFGVAQRRRRVFVVGYLGDWQRAAAVLFERDSLSGNSAPSREKREGVAASTGAGAPFSRHEALGEGTGFGIGAAGDPAYTITKGHSHAVAQPMVLMDQGGSVMNVETDMTGTLRRETHGHEPIVCKALYNQGFNHWNNHASTQEANTGKVLRTLWEAIGEEAFAKWGLGILNTLQPPEILRQALHGLSIRPATFSRSWVVCCALGCPIYGSGWLLQSLQETGGEGCPPQGWEPPEQLAGELRAYLSELSQPGAQAQRFMCDLWSSAQGAGILREALSAVQEMGRSTRDQGQSTHGAMQVRRLTAEECEFLQGFPRSYTDIKSKGKATPDGPRYKALGNSMAVPVMAWIGKRINEVEELCKPNK